MVEFTGLELYWALSDGAFRDASLYVRQKRAAVILTEARIHLTRKEFQELEKYASERL